MFRRVAFKGILDYVSACAEQKAAGATEAGQAVSEAPSIYAAWWRRLLSWLVDFVVFIVMAAGIISAVLSSASVLPSEVSVIAFFGLPFAADWLYEALMTSSRRQATLGMLLLGIVVTDMGGKRMHFMRASVWHFAKALCWLTFFIGFAVQFFTPKKQGLHDLIARVVLVPRSRIS
jgi:uncharacterized RDD family membrane protein YckC